MKARLRDKLKIYRPIEHEPEGLIAAAVLMPFFEKDGETFCLFTRRTEHVRDHKGQISFPGGVRDPVDADLRATAVRETEEEIGVAPSQIEMLGRLDDLRTQTGYLVTPFVGWFATPFEIRPNPHEIAEVLTIPWRVLADPATYRQEEMPHPRGGTARYHAYRVEDNLIWGATAAMLHRLQEVLEPSSRFPEDASAAPARCGGESPFPS